MAKKEEEVFVEEPVVIIWDKVLMVPVIGILDSARFMRIMEAMLGKIQTTGAEAIILDIRGVPIVDSAVSQHLIKITKATRLMGCTCIVSGITPSVAQSIVQLGIDVEDMITTSELKDALLKAFNMLGIEVARKKH